MQCEGRQGGPSYLEPPDPEKGKLWGRRKKKIQSALGGRRFCGWLAANAGKFTGIRGKVEDGVRFGVHFAASKDDAGKDVRGGMELDWV